ncbi:GmrSD restriction endonuclease domain-containing protein [Rhodococcus sp. NM-2]|uniref:GmrSD restriction endonuclease domain-containing protein n=1 Tax=Rhodococcus sp. NM-2 TaxID=3401174 RepID=UPI003AAF6307
MSSITPYYRTITQLLQSRSFAIDEYQREYKWERENIEELVSDLLGKFETSYREGDLPKKASEYADYFLGSIIVTKRSNKSYLVDGQQRVTSLTLLLIYLYRAAKERGLGVASTIEPLIFSDNYGEQSFNLDITERVPVIRALFNGETYNADGKEESIQTILARYEDITNIDLAGQLGDAVATFVYWLINNVGLIEISTDTDGHAYSIFETMNDRGKPLSPVDMLKAYLLGPIDTEDGRTTANRVWKKTVLDLISWAPDPDAERDAACIKAWLRSQYANSTRDRRAGAIDKDWELIGTTFHRWLRDNEGHVGVGDSQHNLRIMTEEFPFFARAYQTILAASRTYTAGLESVFYNAHNEFTWQSTVLLAPLTVDDDDETVRRKIEVTAAYLDIWLMRRTVNYIRVGYSSVSYAMWSLCKDIRRKPLPDLIDLLVQKLNQDDATFEGSPNRGREGIADWRLNQFSRRYIYHLLARVTAFVDVGAGKADQFDKYIDRKQKNPYDIEHIWADKFERYQEEFGTRQDFETWRNEVSGLVLLPADVNRSYQDKPFEQKAPHYAKQNFYAASLTRSAYQHQPQFAQFCAAESLAFTPYEHFGKVEQKQRSELVLALANKIWSPSRMEELRP